MPFEIFERKVIILGDVVILIYEYLKEKYVKSKS